ncbi:MAG TPA: helicase HerA-like domain-containing protein [Candidatus Limnocylindrales bacterium]|nr:helicase HerA-like domain-containing protein [Candidatus Limnocylindrales bacterium]
MDASFRSAMQEGYQLDEPSIIVGGAMHEGEVLREPHVAVALSMTNRHGLIAGATGTGKTKTLQLLAGQMSKAGVPVFISDIKGDVSGLGAPGDAGNAKIQERMASLGLPFEPSAHPIELLSLSGMLGAQVRATVSSFGPLLLGKVLDLNETQTSILSLIFKYCDDHDLPLLDLEDLATTLKFLSSDEGKPFLEEYGGMSPSSVGVLLRSIIVLEQEGIDAFFGEPEFDVADLLRTTPDGHGVVSILELSDVMDQPRLFSTFMLWMLARLYEYLPEVGDLPKPKLVFFFDEAHLLFKDASDALMEQIERTARLIRSKGVGVYFVTQAPTDVPASVLAQLGNRIQHALRAFTPDDADALRKTARTFPMTDFYDVEEAITSLGTGEALVTVLSPRGVPTPLAATRLIAPDSLMAPLPPAELQARIAASLINTKYATAVDRDSAHEIITARLAEARSTAAELAAAEAARADVEPTTAGGLNTMTPAQQRREIERRAREIRAAEKAAERARKAEERRLASLERLRVQQERARQRQVETAIRTGGKVLTSRVGQDIIRGVFGTLFGGRK